MNKKYYHRQGTIFIRKYKMTAKEIAALLQIKVKRVYILHYSKGKSLKKMIEEKQKGGEK